MESGRNFFDNYYHGNMLLFGNDDTVFRGVRSAMSVDETSKRRHFFSTGEEVYDDEYYDEQLTEKKRRLTPEQVYELEKRFEVENKLEPDSKTHLAHKLGLQPRQVAVWFQNRRARCKNKQLERDYDQLKASYDSLLENYNIANKENDKLKAKVLSLTEKFQIKESTEDPVPCPKFDLVQGDEPSCLQLTVKVEDRLSTDADNSAIKDDGRQLLDSGDSYLLNSEYPNYMATVYGLKSEEEDGSDDGDNYLTYVFTASDHHNEEGESLGWSMWS